MPADKSNTSLNATKLPSAQVKEEPVQSAASSVTICAEGYPPGQNTQAASSGEQRARQESATELLDPQVQQKRIQFAVPIATVIAARDVPVHDSRQAVGAEQPASQEHAHITVAKGRVAQDKKCLRRT